MESDVEIRAQLRELERAEAAPYVDNPPTPRWFVPTAALWAAALAALVRLSRSDALPAQIAAVVGILALASLIGVYVGWYQRYHGAMPSMRGRKPVEVRRVMRGYLAGAALVLAVNAAVVAVAPWWACAAVAFVTAGTGLWWYEHAYARAAAATRDRLA
ncbi:hypothetical protein [Mumia quercus]|uniref:hypothetical protein n=1 Tax=Mumia quercus TaxID=2976125 RepID=UPI0021D33EF1|nr:hypothetical protein [Mumia quercus]